MTGSTSTKPLIEHADEMEAYSPPNHQGTRNVRLVDREFCGGYEMIRGIVQPGGEAQPHYHEAEHQVMYIVRGMAEVTLGGDAPRQCGPGTVIRIPPRLLHRVVCRGSEPLEAVIVYSPPLPKHGAFRPAGEAHRSSAAP